MKYTLAHRETLSLILASKLDEEGAKMLEKNISAFMLEQANEFLDDFAQYLVESRREGRMKLDGMALAGLELGLELSMDRLKKLKDFNKDALIEILKK